MLGLACNSATLFFSTLSPVDALMKSQELKLSDLVALAKSLGGQEYREGLVREDLRQIESFIEDWKWWWERSYRPGKWEYMGTTDKRKIRAMLLREKQVNDIHRKRARKRLAELRPKTRRLEAEVAGAQRQFWTLGRESGRVKP